VELALVAGAEAGAEEAELLSLDAAKLGGGTAVLGSRRAPIPQGMAAPFSGCVALGGGVVWPEEDAMANRVVHSLLVARAEEYW
jgi:hypothetical protein